MTEFVQVLSNQTARSTTAVLRVNETVDYMFDVLSIDQYVISRWLVMLEKKIQFDILLDFSISSYDGMLVRQKSSRRNRL